MEFTKEQQNFFKLCHIVYDIVSEGLLRIFKQEWDALYTASHGQRFHNMEGTYEWLLSMMSSGGRKDWNSICLIYTILNCRLGPRLSSAVKNGVDELLACRDELAQKTHGKISETEFQLSIQKIKVAFSSLELDTTRIKEIEKWEFLATEYLTNMKIKLDVQEEEKRNSEPNSFCKLPPHPSHNIIHRKKEFDKIYKIMQRLSSENKGKTTVVYLSGNPGCGKSVMARQIGKMCYDGDTTETLKFVMTLDASTLDNLLNSYITFAEKLNCYPDSVTMIITSKDLSKEEQILLLNSLVSKQVAKYSKWWIIADNVTDLNIFSKYCTQGGEKTSGEGQILVTTQDSVSIPIIPECYHVSLSTGMTEEDAIELLSVESGHRDAENHVMLKVSRALDFQPLALAAAEFYVRTVGQQYTWLQYLKDLEENREKLERIFHGVFLSYQEPMTVAVNLALHREITEDIMLHAFRFLSITGSGPIPLEYAVEYVAKYLPDEDKNLIASRICSSSLLMILDLKNISMHRVVYYLLQRNPYITEDRVPSEILARGPKAHLAYQTALKSGKVKNCRVPIVVVGQSRSGKTSLLRSLYREKFNPSEDSTVGAKLQRSLCKAEEGDWEKTETDEHTVYNRCAARAMAPQLLTTDSINSDSDDSDDNDNSLEEENVENDDSKAFPVEKKVLHFDEDSEVAKEETTQEDFEIHKDVLEPKQLPEQVATCAENILENPDSVKQMENDLFLHTMDFAGQPVYSVTHPVFLPTKGIFLLVHNLENDLHAQATPMVKCGAAERIIDDHCPMTNMDHLESWLSLIAANSTLEGGSPVFVVSTHADKPSKPDVKQTARQILQTLKREDFAPRSHVVNGLYTVDNTVSGSGGPDDPGVQCLKVALSNEARNLPQLNEDIPIRWLSFEKRLLSLVSEKKEKYISHEVAKTIALECGVDVNSDEFNTLLDYLHDLKVIIYFPETNMIIIDTQWLLDMFAKVITVQPIECHHKKYESEWRKLEEHGIISVNFLKHLWCDLLDDHSSFQSLIDIMEKFSLICNWKQLDGGTSYLVPAMLMNTSEEKANALVADNLAPPLVIRFDCSHLPFAIFPRLLVLVEKMCNSKWPCSSPPHLSKNFARFYIVDDKCAFSLVLKSDLQTIRVALFSDKRKGNNRNGFFVNLCKWLTEFLERTLQKMIESFPWMRRLELEFGICCPVCKDVAPCKKHGKTACPRDSCFHFVSKRELLSTIQTRCSRSPTKLNNEILDSSFSHWFDRKDNKAAGVKEVQEQLQALHLASEFDALCQEVFADVNDKISLKTISQDEVTRIAEKVAVILNLDKHSTATPPKDIIQKCRTICRWLIAQGGEVFVEALRKELPSGMTGPLRVGYDVKVCDMDSATKTQLSKELTVKKDEWKAFAKEKVGLSHVDVEFLNDREKNPVLEILNEHCRDWSVEQLYDAVSSVGAEAVADRYF